jgi:riboflavin biosynthesis pyrimidine reductase
MRPYVICHMVASLDGRTLPSRWAPGEVNLHGAYERLHEQLDGQAWLVGRVTGQEFAKAQAHPQAEGTFPPEPWFARKDAAAYAVVLDPQGKIAWGRSDIGGDPIVVILAETVTDSHLAGLRQDRVSYVFAGAQEVRLDLALEILNRELGIERLLLEGGGHVNGSFLRAGLVDEISLILVPAIDGRQGAPSLFDGGAADPAAPLKALRLDHSEVLAGGAIWLRYRLEAAA